jgi:hypothetical protein
MNKLSKSNKIQAELLNKLQCITTFVDLSLEGKQPSEKLLRIARRDLKKLERLIRGL